MMNEQITELTIAPWICLMGFFAIIYITWNARW